MCIVENCDRKSYYKGKDLCQMHYFRFRRNGVYEKTKSKKYRTRNEAGYQMVYEPSHKLAQSGGYVYEHRKVAYEKYGDNLPDCEICGKECSWDLYTTHIDHIDGDVKNNQPSNLRPLCNACNSRRGLRPQCEMRGNTAITINSTTKTAEEWSRVDGCTVTGKTIRKRIEDGWSNAEAVYTPSKTIKKQNTQLSNYRKLKKNTKKSSKS